MNDATDRDAAPRAGDDTLGELAARVLGFDAWVKAHSRTCELCAARGRILADHAWGAGWAAAREAACGEGDTNGL